jgi:hypothetical protein
VGAVSALLDGDLLVESVSAERTKMRFEHVFSHRCHVYHVFAFTVVEEVPPVADEATWNSARALRRRPMSTVHRKISMDVASLFEMSMQR